MKKIAHLIHFDGPGGGPRIIISMMKHFRKYHTQMVFGGGLGSIATYCSQNNIPYHNVPTDRKLTALGGLAKLTFKLKRLHPDILLLHGQSAGPLGAIAARMAGIKYVLYIAQWPAFYSDWDMYRLIRNRLCEQIPCSMANQIVAFTPSSRNQYLIRRLSAEEKISCIPPAIDFSCTMSSDTKHRIREQYGWKNDICHVVSVGRLADQKRVDWLLESWEHIQAQNHMVHLWIVGDGPERAALESLSRNLGIQDNCTFLGYKNNGMDFMAASDLVVMTSMYESFGYAALEACACGKPIVASHVDGVMDILSDGEEGFLVPPGDIDQMADKILQLIHNPGLRRQMGEKGIICCDRYKPEKVYAPYLKFFQDEV